MGVGAAEGLLGGGYVLGGTTPTGDNGVVALPVKIAGGGTAVTTADDPDGFELTPAHVHFALRSAIGLCKTGIPNDPLERFALNVLPTTPLPLVSA
jgi:hypothetical protein